MNFFNVFKRASTSSEITKIKSKKDCVALYKQITDDEAISKFLAEVEERIGRDGYIQIKQGGQGRPYAVDYHEYKKYDLKTTKNILSQANRLRETLKRINSELERECLEKKIAEICGGLCTIWINVESVEEFEQKSKLIKKCHMALKTM